MTPPDRDVLSDRSACALCEGEGNVVQGLSIYARDHAYPEIVKCPDCGGTGLASDEIQRPWVDPTSWCTHCGRARTMPELDHCGGCGRRDFADAPKET